MASYTVTGHPLSYFDMGLEAAEDIRIGMYDVPIGGTATLTLSSPDETLMASHVSLVVIPEEE